MFWFGKYLEHRHPLRVEKTKVKGVKPYGQELLY